MTIRHALIFQASIMLLVMVPIKMAQLLFCMLRNIKSYPTKRAARRHHKYPISRVTIAAKVPDCRLMRRKHSHARQARLHSVRHQHPTLIERGSLELSASILASTFSSRGLDAAPAAQTTLRGSAVLTLVMLHRDRPSTVFKHCDSGRAEGETAILWHYSHQQESSLMHG